MKKKVLFTIVLLVIIGGLIFATLSSKNTNQQKVSGYSVTTTLKTTNETPYSLDEIGLHNVESDCWMAIDGNVYDVTSFIASGKHNSLILEGCGKDATEMFNKEGKHRGPEAQNVLQESQIGILKQDSAQ